MDAKKEWCYWTTSPESGSAVGKVKGEHCDAANTNTASLTRALVTSKCGEICGGGKVAVYLLRGTKCKIMCVAERRAQSIPPWGGKKKTSSCI